jgi:hypothetical protein
VSYDSAIDHLELSPAEYGDFIDSPFVNEHLAGERRVALIVVRGDVSGLVSPGSLPTVVVWVGDEFGGHGPMNADAVMGESDLEQLRRSVDRSPMAAATLALLLRSQPTLPVHGGLVAESAAYSMLQSGPEFAAWRAATTPSPFADTGPVVRVERDGTRLEIVLDRPHRHNAISTALRDELCAALSLAMADDSIRSVVLRGDGASFCSGGDLAEFGQRADPATAHVTRLACSPARLIHQLGDRLECRIHGSTLGGGIEMAAFASHVVAQADTLIALPEIGLGLIPGAGGTVSLTRRIGRQRTAALGLTGRTIDAETALRWGLVDEITP